MVRITTTSLLAFGILSLPVGGHAANDPVALFNGKDLTGWRYGKEDLAGKTETEDRRFAVRDGVIVAEDGEGTKSINTTRACDTNFRLTLQFRAGPKADSGVYVRGPQLQVRDFVRRGEQKQLKGFKNDDWNDLDVVVTNDQLIAKVNGKPLGASTLDLTVKNGEAVVKVDDAETPLSKVEVVMTAIAHCTVNGEFLEAMPVPNASTQGIGLQAEKGKFEFRNIRLQPLE